MSQERLYLYPIWLRFWHLVNAILCFILIVTGIILTINYRIFFIGNLFTFNGKQYQIEYRGLSSRLMKQARYYAFGIFTGENPPFPISKENKFNPLQRFSYVFIMYLFIPVVFITGFALLYPNT
ncbi:MAG: cytochrome b/b6 domain-containing protein, partial [Deltaproteobacteria bacterium]|nr:cytochrome b/b6 domain-containing protein [Deltaproteobacteria bacterium]